MPIVTAISIEGLIILGTWPIPFLLGGVVGWVLRGCLAVREAVRERVPENDDSEPESTNSSDREAVYEVMG